MIGRDYFARQAVTLLRLARLTRDPRQSAAIAAKAAELKAKSEEAPPDAASGDGNKTQDR